MFNIGTGKPVTINELASLVLKIVGKENLKPVYEKPREGEIKHSVADIVKAVNHLNYAPQYTLEEGLRKTIEFLSGNTDICPYCHMHRDTFFLGHEYERKKILEQLNVVNTKAYRKFIKGYKEAKKEGKPLPQPNEMRKLLNSLGFNCTFYGKPVFVSLNTMIHLALDHSERLKKMLNSGTLVPKNKAVKSYFLSEKWKQEPKRSKQELSDVLKVPSVEEKLCPKEKALIEWFKKGN